MNQNNPTFRFFCLVPTGSMILLAALLASCTSLRQLDDFKELAAKAEYGKIANTPVDCKAEDDGCNQSHLIKGDACYRLAKANTDPAPNYLCAATELEQGIQQTGDWKSLEPVLGKPELYYENFCESLRMVRDSQTSNAASLPYNRKLADCARNFPRPDGHSHPAAVFFRNNSRVADIRLNFNELKGKPGIVCPELGRLLQEEQAEVGQQTPYTANHQQLLRDIFLFISSIPGCKNPN
ncbi:MAG: hypothetical protein CTY34_11030 [Methylobacter sp.]|nr:MAG: hypothetical protein CTY34_11030 [Methylobacter sp.]PPD02729.1 MAG: hypothetical protein CTY29_12080 [Methylobacter sp.]PPD21874.1 MAG: hypothetical protein CTY24_07190 [Methylobacter sp.]PPD36191.1 MAG: hypothetical protein CTY18_04940 [Methylomonas sp.]